MNGTATALLLLIALPIAAEPVRLPAPPIVPPVTTSFTLDWDVRIPLRDGASLHAIVYQPTGLAEPGPALLSLTPYGADGFHAEAAALARRGYAVALADVRGRGGSTGDFEPWRNDGRDGADAVEWLARQPFSNGKVGMFGHSYGGRAVWSTIKESPPHLAAAAPISASYPMREWRNLLTPDMMQWIVLTGRASGGSRILADSEFWLEKFRELYLSERPLRDFDRMVGARSAIFQRFLDHPALDDFWTAPAPTAGDFARIRLPILTITGAYESNGGPLWYYLEHKKHASAEAFSHHRLLIGPWDHHGTLRPSLEAGGLAFGPAAQIDMKGLLADWFDHALRGLPLPEILAVPVRAWALGAEEWRGAIAIDPYTPVGTGGGGRPAAETRTFFFDSRDGEGALSRPGRLAEAAATGRAADGWTFDPHDLRPGRAETAEVADWAARFDAPDDLWGAGLAYATAPLPTPLTLSGRPRLHVWMAIDTPDADFAARLDLLTPDGRTILIGEDWRRARHRASLERVESIPSEQLLEYPFEFPWMLREIPTGSRLRIVLRSPNSIFLGKNWNAGGAVVDESGKDARTVQVTVAHDGGHPSRLELPVLASP